MTTAVAVGDATRPVASPRPRWMLWTALGLLAVFVALAVGVLAAPDAPWTQGLDDLWRRGVGVGPESTLPGFVLAQIQNTLAIRQILPDGLDRTVLNWTYLGFQDDTPELRRMRLKQSNLTGPAGFVSMEDGAVGGFVQRGIAGSDGQAAVLEMGGSGIETQENRTTEASVRGFWNAYRGYMEI